MGSKSNVRGFSERWKKLAPDTSLAGPPKIGCYIKTGCATKSRKPTDKIDEEGWHFGSKWPFRANCPACTLTHCCKGFPQRSLKRKQELLTNGWHKFAKLLHQHLCHLMRVEHGIKFCWSVRGFARKMGPRGRRSSLLATFGFLLKSEFAMRQSRTTSDSSHPKTRQVCCLK